MTINKFPIYQDFITRLQLFSESVNNLEGMTSLLSNLESFKLEINNDDDLFRYLAFMRSPETCFIIKYRDKNEGFERDIVNDLIDLFYGRINREDIEKKLYNSHNRNDLSNAEKSQLMMCQKMNFRLNRKIRRNLTKKVKFIFNIYVALEEYDENCKLLNENNINCLIDYLNFLSLEKNSQILSYRDLKKFFNAFNPLKYKVDLSESSKRLDKNSPIAKEIKKGLMEEKLSKDSLDDLEDFRIHLPIDKFYL